MRTPSTTASDFDSCRGAKGAFGPIALLLLLLAGLLVAAVAAPTAYGATTHPFLHDIAIAGESQVEPVAVDADGNLLVWLNGKHVLAKYDTAGNPVNFSGLGTNVLDGIGNYDCPNTPSDCDQVPTVPGRVGFGYLQAGNQSHRVVAVDSSGGPADGYIYIPLENEIAVFDDGGRYLGAMDMSLVGPGTYKVPGSRYGGEPNGISISANGTVYIVYQGSPGGSHVDAFGPVDGNPFHDEFIGQMHPGVDPDEPFFPAAIYSDVLAGDNTIYVNGYAIGGASWLKYSLSEFAKRGPYSQTFAIPIDLSNGTAPTYTVPTAPFGNSGQTGCCGARSITLIDPDTEDAYLGYTNGDFQQWSPANQKVGPNFGEGHVGFGSMMAMDSTGGPADGNIYVQDQDWSKIAVFGPPVTIPDITVHPDEVGHEEADISATIGTAGGPNVTSCQLEYADSTLYDTYGTYGTTVPCNEPTPYGGDTEINLNIAGLAVEADYHYRIKAGSVNGTNVTVDHSFHTHAVLDLKTEAASDLDRTSATLNGSLNPDGIATEYAYEWGASDQYGEKTPWVPAPAGTTEAKMPPIGIAGLQSGRTFHFRLIAKNSLGTTYGTDMTLVVPNSPKILSVRPLNVTMTSADMTARVSPGGFASTYHFEYGTSASYGNETPEADLGEGNVAKEVSDPLTGMEPGVTYHFRVVATNKWGTSTSGDATIDFLPPSCPNSHIRQQIGANYLPDCRAFELVSPEEASGAVLFPGSVVYGTGNLQLFATLSPPNGRGSASAPSRFGFFGGFGALPGLHPPNAIIDRYVSTRTSTGWVTTYPGRPSDQTLAVVKARCNASMSACIDIEADDIFGGILGSTAPFMWDTEGGSLGRLPTNFDEVSNARRAVETEALSQSYDHYVFGARTAVFAPGGIETGPGSVYDNDTVADTVTVISKLPNGDPIPSDGGGEEEVIKLPAISDDGSHVLMSTSSSEGGRDLYMSVDDSIRYDVSKGAGVAFVGMTYSGDKVYFTTTAHLQPEDTDSGADLYMWSEATDSLTLISKGNGNGDSDSCAAGWVSSCGVAPLKTEKPTLDNVLAGGSGDVYFYSPEQLDAANPGVHNERNLYVFRKGALHYVTTLDPGTQVNRMQISPDGDHAAFVTRSQVTGYDNEGWTEMYTYDPATGANRCASCQPSGEPPAIGHLRPISGSSEMIRDITASESGPFMTDDGRVAFATSDALVESDTNQSLDVYEYVNSRPQLISGGTETRYYYPGANFLFKALEIGFEGFSTDGTDLYFSTYDTLVPQDRNGRFVKFYDARTGGGFPVQKDLLPCTAADECHGDSSQPAVGLAVGSGAKLGGDGNAAVPKKKKKHRKHRGRKGRAKHKKHKKQHRRNGATDGRDG